MPAIGGGREECPHGLGYDLKGLSTMDNREYIIKHRHEDVRRLALGRAEQGVDMPFCLRQIEAWQKACTKLPRWAETDDKIGRAHV